MDAERWHHIERFLDAAFDLPPEERADYLDDACDDPAVRAEVESLLNAEANAPPFLNDDAADLAAPMMDDVVEASPDDERRIGPYRLLEEIGRGGMSVVYRAERADGHFEQQVALKLLPRYFETESRIIRFRAERQILASLDHPNIARLVDGGLTDAGRPYLVMEHVEGQPLTDYCEHNDLSLADRLDLLQDVCRAVQHAHRRLVVHRDLKPSNILVTETEEGPRVKLLDFGIAKLLDEGTAAWTTPITRTGERLLTPEYAAPEQIRGEAISTATDVYQLGMLAYELLTGDRPFDLGDKSLPEIERIVTTTNPDPPSTHVDGPEEHTRRLRGDLDTIVLKALRKEPDRRYASAEALADDLQHYLDGRPIQARPATWRYRAKKFIYRNRGSVTTAAIIALLIMGYAVTVTMQAQHIAAERDRAQQETEKAEQVSSFLMNLFQASDPGQTRGDTVTARELLQRGEERIETLADQPEVQSEMQSVIGRVYMQIGLYDKATPLFEEALTTRRERYADEPTKPLANSLHNLGSNHHAMGRYEKAEALYREALAIWRELPDAERSDMVRTLNNLAGILRAQGNYEDAVAIQSETITMARRLLGDDAPILASALGNLAEIHHNQGNLQRADSLYQAGWTVGQRVLGEDHPNMLSLRSNQAELYRETGRLDQAETVQRAVLEMRNKRYPDHKVRLGLSRTALGHTLRAQENYAAAEPLYRSALDDLRPRLPDDHRLIADALMGLGATLTELGHTDEAESLLRRSQSIYAEQRPDSWQMAEVQALLGRCLSQQGRYAEAESFLLNGYHTLEDLRGPDDLYTRLAARHLTALYTEWNKPDAAIPYRSVLEN